MSDKLFEKLPGGYIWDDYNISYIQNWRGGMLVMVQTKMSQFISVWFFGGEGMT